MEFYATLDHDREAMCSPLLLYPGWVLFNAVVDGGALCIRRRTTLGTGFYLNEEAYLTRDSPNFPFGQVTDPDH